MTSIHAMETERIEAIVARRARGLLAEQQSKQSELALRLGLSKSAMSKRLSGAMEFALSEVPALADALGTNEAYLLGFTSDARSPRPGDLDGATRAMYGIRDSNPEPAD